MSETPALLARTRLVLEHPFFPENVGSVARSMRNMGLARLEVVGGESPLHPQARKLAVRSEALLESARVHDSLDAALEGATLILGTTSRAPSEMRPLTPREAAQLAKGHEGQVALVFGNEKNGLSNAALRRCHEVVRIPCLVPDASLNLAQAATILCYEWLVTALEGGPPDPLVGWTAIAPEDELQPLVAHLDAALTEAGFFKPHQAARRKAVLLRLLGRMRLDPEEVSLLRGVARRLSWFFARR